MDKEKGLCYKVKPSLDLFKTNLGSAWCEILQEGNKINGKTNGEKQLQTQEQFANLSQAHRTVYNNYLNKYESLAQKWGVTLVKDEIR